MYITDALSEYEDVLASLFAIQLNSDLAIGITDLGLRKESQPFMKYLEQLK